MPQPNTHLLLIQQTFVEYILEGRRNYKLIDQLLENYSNYAYLGSVMPDIFYFKDIFSRHRPYEQVANVRHWDGSFDYYCRMIEHAKKSDSISQYKQLAVALGDISHSIGDDIFHGALVYPTSMDHWRLHPRETAEAHKKLENLIDTFLLKEKADLNPHQRHYPNLIKCHEDNSGRTLDQSIFELLNNAMVKTYGSRMEGAKENFFESEGLNYFTLFGRFKPEDPNHPIREAYRDLMSYSRIPFYLPKNLDNYFGLRGIIPADELSNEETNIMVSNYWNDNFFNVLKRHDIRTLLGKIPKRDPNERRWFNEESQLLPRYTVLKLFDLSVKAMKAVVEASVAFLESDSENASEFFKQNAKNVIYLENYNLDTGRPSMLNDELRTLGNDLEKIYNFRLKIVDENLIRIAGYPKNLLPPPDMAA